MNRKHNARCEASGTAEVAAGGAVDLLQHTTKGLTLQDRTEAADALRRASRRQFLAGLLGAALACLRAADRLESEGDNEQTD
jgi:hypothetical protein